MIGLTDFVFDQNNRHQFEHRGSWVDTGSGKAADPTKEMRYLELPKFGKALAELETEADRWPFAMRNLHRLSERPPALSAPAFDQVFAIAQISQLTEQQRQAYRAAQQEIGRF